MKLKKIFEVLEVYSKRLEEEKVTPQEGSREKALGAYTEAELLGHAFFLVKKIPSYHRDKEFAKINRHFAAVQMCLTFARWYTLGEIMKHNL